MTLPCSCILSGDPCGTRGSRDKTGRHLRGAEMVGADPEWSTQQILDEIKNKTSWAKENPGYIIQPFSALLVRLVRESEATAKAVNDKTDELITLTRVLIVMTGIIIILTVPLVLIESVKFCSEFFQCPLHPIEHNDSNGQSYPKP